MHTLIDASHPSDDASGPHQTAYKSKLNYWHLLKVAEVVCWRQRLPRVRCRSAGVLSHSLHLVVGSIKAACSSALFFLASCLLLCLLLWLQQTDKTPSCCGWVDAQLTSDDASQLSTLSSQLWLSLPLSFISFFPIPLSSCGHAGCSARCPLLTSINSRFHSLSPSISFPPSTFLHASLLLFSTSHCVCHPPCFSHVYELFCWKHKGLHARQEMCVSVYSCVTVMICIH